MSLTSVPLSAGNLRSCISLWADRRGYSGGEFERALANASRLLTEARALGDVITDHGRVTAFGMSTFVNAQFAETFLAEPHPQIGKRLLLEAYGSASQVLTRDQTATGNRVGGLQLFIVNANYEKRAPNAPAVFAALLVAFLETHRGYRIERIVNEAFTRDAILSGESAGLRVVRRFEEVCPGSGLRSVIAVMTREEAVSAKAILLPTFIYEAPKLRLTACEQDLVRAALSGGTDEHLSATLRLSLSSVKARWRRIQQRAMQYVPELLANVRPHSGEHRGAQTRHLLLEYFRKNPSELTPYEWKEPVCLTPNAQNRLTWRRIQQ